MKDALALALSFVAAHLCEEISTSARQPSAGAEVVKQRHMQGALIGWLSCIFFSPNGGIASPSIVTLERAISGSSQS